MKAIYADTKEFKKLFYNPYQVESLHPYGYCYTQNGEWLKNAITVGTWKKQKYFYEFTLNYTTINKPDPHKVLQIKNENDFLQVTYKYGFLEQTANFFDVIKIEWPKIEKHFGGIEVTPGLKTTIDINNNPEIITKFRKKGWGLSDFGYTIIITWLDTFDTTNGCVWNKDAIKNVKKINKSTIKPIKKTTRKSSKKSIKKRKSKK